MKSYRNILSRKERDNSGVEEMFDNNRRTFRLYETKILIDFVNSYDIKTLTANSFIIYKKDMVGASDYDEETITWTK